MSECLNLFRNLIVITLFRITTDEIAEETGDEELGAKKHHREREIEIGRVGDEACRRAVGERHEFVDANDEHSDETDDEHE